MQNHTDYISLNVVHYAFSNGSSNVLPEMMRNHIGSICLTFLHCVFSNKSSKCLLDKKQNHTFAIVCFQMGPQIACLIRCIATLVALREGTTYHFSCFFIKFIKGGGSFSFIKIYVVNFVYSGGLWQHEIGIEKVF